MYELFKGMYSQLNVYIFLKLLKELTLNIKSVVNRFMSYFVELEPRLTFSTWVQLNII